jgi:hypothetical protein
MEGWREEGRGGRTDGRTDGRTEGGREGGREGGGVNNLGTKKAKMQTRALTDMRAPWYVANVTRARVLVEKERWERGRVREGGREGGRGREGEREGGRICAMVHVERAALERRTE